jgi:hydroxycarboxylate dehydrogenase B
MSETLGTDNFVVPAPILHGYLSLLFTRFGATAETAQEVADHLIEANLTGHDSHGALRAPWYLEKIELGELDPQAVPAVVKETPTTAVIDGGWGFGQPASRLAMELAIDKAEQMGVACVAVRNANHMGRVGYYTGMAAAAGMIGLGCVNLHGASPCVAPFGGIDRRLPTNPFSIAFPADRYPHFLADMTTSVVAEGKLQMRRNRGLAADQNWIIDHDGNATTDPWDFYKEPVGALLPMGGVVAHKGFALSMAIEGLAGALSGAGCSNPEATRHGNACWYTVIKIEAFTPLAQFKTDVGKLIDHVKSSRKATGVSDILYPGQPEEMRRQERLKTGIPVDPQTWDWLAQKAAKVDVALPPVKRA